MILTKKEFAEKFNLSIPYLCPFNEQHIRNGLQKRGFNIIKCNWAQRNTSFEVEEIANDQYKNEKWKSIPFKPEYLVSDKGRIKNPQGKFLEGTDDKGYRRVNLGSASGTEQAYAIHRLVKLTFDPIENAEIFLVDHINGKRNDNRLENLRWVFQTDNNKLSDDNNTQIKEIIPQLIKKFGYKKTQQKLLELLNEN